MGPEPAGLNQIEAIFKNVVQVILGLGFVAMLVLLIWSGFKFLFSGGEPKALSSARAAMAWAILGIVFIALSWMILLLIKNFTGIDVTTFNIKKLMP